MQGIRDDDAPGGAAARLTDAAYRLAYRIAFRLARLWWLVRRPARHGVVVAVWHAGRVLIVRQSYRAGATFPGGGLHGGEDAEQAALRELREEVGLALPPGRLRFAAAIRVPFEACDDHVRVYEVTLEAAPPLRPDRREVLWAGFLPPAEALRDAAMAPYVRQYLEAR